METLNLTANQQKVVNLLEEEDLTSFQIFKKIEEISLILVLYNIIDELCKIGILKSYFNNNTKYYSLHYIN